MLSPLVTIFFDLLNIKMFDCSFDHNIGDKSIVYINAPTTGVSNIPNISLTLENSTFSNNKGTALHLIIPKLQFKGNVLFASNLATNGAAVYLEEVYSVSSDDNVVVQFINNSARQNGGAMFINLVTYHCDVFKDISNPTAISFTDNSARIADNHIYFSIYQTCHINNSLLYYPN